MAADEFVTAYLDALAEADLPAVLALFAEDAVVHSPLSGTLSAREFYPALFADTVESVLQLRAVMQGEREGYPVVSFWFDFDWTLGNGTPAPFTAVGVAELDPEGLIQQRHIVYDTAPIRAAFASQHAS